MHVARLSITPLKGTAHVRPEALFFDARGPRNDRRFCLVDPGAARVLRTVENPTLVACRAEYADARLHVRFPDGTDVSGEVGDGSERLSVDYWGRLTQVRCVPGSWSAAFSTYLQRDVVLTEVERPGAVVFGAAVTVLTTSSLRELARRLGRQLDGGGLLADSERFRSTVVVDTGNARAFVEDSWVGEELVIGGAVVTVSGPVPRCAVVRIAPGGGTRDKADPLRALAPDRTELNARGAEVIFGVEAHVVRPGAVEVGDAVTVTAGDLSTPTIRSAVHATTGP